MPSIIGYTALTASAVLPVFAARVVLGLLLTIVNRRER
jgi:hypothetical protein